MVPGIENPEPAWLRRKLPVNNCLQNPVSFICYNSQDAAREKKPLHQYHNTLQSHPI